MSEPPRVLQVLQPEDGGVAEHVLLLARGLARRGFSVEVASSPTNTIRPALRREGITSHAIPIERRPSVADVRAARAVRALDRRGRYDLVHAHSSKAGGLVRAALPRRRRFVYTPHCFAFAASSGEGGAEALLYRALEQALVPRTAAIVAVADWERRLAERALRGSRSRLRLVRNGVPPCPTVEPARELLVFAAGRPLAGLVAVLRPQKDPLGMVRAAALLARRAPDAARVAIVGNGWLEPQVRAAIEREGVGESVRWFPFEPPAARYLAALDVFVLPSLWEALPVAPIEALACGVPVVATRVGGVPEVVDHGGTGLLVEPGRPEALADALETLLGDPARRRAMAERGRRVAAERFDVETMVRATEAVYAEVLAQARR
ncbi:MAG: glycosyltransferase [Thermoleophilaceae bacterium]